MDRHSTIDIPADAVAGHPAAEAWLQLAYGNARPRAITALKAQVKPSQKSGVYRLHAVGVDGASVVAKRCLVVSGQVEREMYERVLPGFALPRLQYYGSLDEAEGVYCWIFIEDAGDDVPKAGQGVSAARWLADVHVQAAHMDLSRFPDRGPWHYLAHVTAAKELERYASHPGLTEDDRAEIHALLALLARLEANFARLDQFCSAMPSTLVHGDFVPKNVRVRQDGGDTSFFALDWETAGRGCPAADLAELDACFGGQGGERPLDAYLARGAGLWDHVPYERVVLLARVGTVLRLAASIRWATAGLRYDYVERPMRNLRVYRERLAATLHTVEEL